MKRKVNRAGAGQEERDLALELRDKLTADDRALLKATEAIIDEHSELFELLAQE